MLTDVDGMLKQRSLPNLCNESKLSVSSGNNFDDLEAAEEPYSTVLKHSPSSTNGTSTGVPPVIDSRKSTRGNMSGDDNEMVRSESPTVALQKSGIPLAKSGIPRPSSTSKLPAHLK